MGEFTDVPGPPENKPDVEEKEEVKTYETDVPDVMAADIIKQGHNEFPVFDCSQDEFYQNMQNGRKRLRFKKDSQAGKYMAGTKYKKAFYIRTTDSSGETYTRKIK